MPRTSAELRHRMLRLLKEDEEFRYSVAGLLGMEEILKRLKEHDKKFNEVISRLDEHDRKFNEVILEIRNLREDMVRLRSDVGGLSNTVGAMSESGARKALREWLRDRGLTAERLRPMTVVVDGEEREINFYGEAVDREGRRKPLYAEAKATVRAREVREFARLSREAEKIHGEGVKAIIAYRIYEDAYEAAEEEKISVIEA